MDDAFFDHIWFSGVLYLCCRLAANRESCASGKNGGLVVPTRFKEILCRNFCLVIGPKCLNVWLHGGDSPYVINHRKGEEFAVVACIWDIRTLAEFRRRETYAVRFLGFERLFPEVRAESRGIVGAFNVFASAANVREVKFAALGPRAVLCLVAQGGARTCPIWDARAGR